MLLAWVPIIALELGCTAPPPLIAPVGFRAEPQRVTDEAPRAGAQRISDSLERGRACVIDDFDGDGRFDLYAGNPADPSGWIRNVTEPGGPLQFEPGAVLTQQGLLWGAAAGDLDNDGLVDLFAAVGGNEGAGYDRYFHNDGDGELTDLAPKLGIRERANPELPRGVSSAGVALVDVDADGWLDIWINVNVVPRAELPKAPKGSSLGRNLLWQNRQDEFVDVTLAAGLANRALTRHSAWLDIDNDGDLDLYENNFLGNNVLWRNTLRETDQPGFERVTQDFSLEGTDLRYPRNSFASAAADFNQDGWEDLFVFARGWPRGGPHPHGHALFLNVEGRGFVEVSEASGFNAFFDPYMVAGDGGGDCGDLTDAPVDGNLSSLGVMGASVADLNQDGVPDVLIGNGGPSGGMYDQLWLSEGLVRTEFPGVGSVNVPRFVDGSRWTDWPAAQDEDLPEFPRYPYKTHGMCVGDLDDDGGLEVYVVNGGPSFLVNDLAQQEPNRLFKFDFGDRHWLKVRVTGDGVNVNRSAIGTRVDAVLRREDGTRWTVMDRLRSANGFSAQHAPELLLGLGDAVVVESLTVTWTDGEVAEMRDISPNQMVSFVR